MTSLSDKVGPEGVGHLYRQIGNSPEHTQTQSQNHAACNSDTQSANNTKDGEEMLSPTWRWRTQPQRNQSFKVKAVMLLFSFWCSICGGGIYAFSDISGDLKTCCQWTNSQIANVYSFGQLGSSGVGVILALIYRSSERYGAIRGMIYAIWNIWIGSVLSLIGVHTLPNSDLKKIITGKEDSDQCVSSDLAAVGYGIVQNGVNSLFQVCLFYQLGRVSKEYSGLMTGTLTSAYGISALIWSVFYRDVVLKDVFIFFLLTGLMWTATGVLGLFLFQFLYTPSLSLSTKDNQDAKNSQLNNINNIGWNQQDESNWRQWQLNDEESNPNAQPLLNDEQEELPNQQQQNHTQSLSLIGRWKKLAQENIYYYKNTEKITTKYMLTRMPSYWCIVIQFSFIHAIGSSFFLGNLGLITGSLGFSDESLGDVIMLQSLANAFSRLMVGVAMDFGLKNYGLERARHFLITSSLMLFPLVALLYPSTVVGGLLLNLNSISKFLPFVILGLVFGANTTILAATVSSWFGQQNVPIGYNICMVIFVAIGNTMSYVVAYTYTIKLDEQTKGFFNWILYSVWGQEQFCKPAAKCFAFTGEISIGMCIVSCLTGLLLLKIRPSVGNVSKS